MTYLELYSRERKCRVTFRVDKIIRICPEMPIAMNSPRCWITLEGCEQELFTGDYKTITNKMKGGSDGE